MDNGSQIMKLNGKSFYWATKFMDKKVLDSIYAIYELCRKIDDMVDEQDAHKAKQDLEFLKKNISIGKLKKQFPVLNIINDNQFPQEKYINEFIKGQESDLEFKQPKSINELLKYCYRVAGVVGLMLCDALEIKDKKLRYYAIDLGIAMQLTNIARDIDEDLSKGRVYIPVNMVGKIDIEKIIDNEKEMKINNKKLELLNIASKYFKSANKAIEVLPSNISKGFGLASQLYEGIGKKIIKKSKSYKEGRIYLNIYEKLEITIKYFMKIQTKKKYVIPHNKILHFPIKTSPDVNA